MQKGRGGSFKKRAMTEPKRSSHRLANLAFGLVRNLSSGMADGETLARPSTPLRKGCWTCVVRHKRCDNAFPSCQLCVRLGITCAGYDEEKPDWFDGGEKLAKYKEDIKDDIKRRRHNNKKPGSGSQPLTPSMTPSQPSPWGEPIWAGSNLAPFGLFHPETPYFSSTTSPNYSFEGRAVSSVASHTSAEPEPTAPTTHDALSWETWSANQNYLVQYEASDEVLIMDYLDRYFPSMLPFCCVTGGRQERGVLLYLTNHSPVFRKIVLAISKQHLTPETQMVQQDTNAKESLPSITELIAICEDPAGGDPQGSERFADQRQMVKKYEERFFAIEHYIYALRLGIVRDEVSLELLATLARLASKSMKVLVPPIWNIDQCRAGQVLTCRMARTLILGASLFSVSHPFSEQIHAYATDVLSYIPSDIYKATGCSVETLRCIQSISRLVSWKTSQLQAGSLSMMQLFEKVQEIEKALNTERARIETALQSLSGLNPSACPAFRNDRTIHCGIGQAFNMATNCSWHSIVALVTCSLYVYAAKLFLYALMSGVNPKLPETAETIAASSKALQHLHSIKAPVAMEITGPLLIIAVSIDRSSQSGQYLSGWLASLLQEWSQTIPRFETVLATIRKWWSYQDSDTSHDISLDVFLAEITKLPVLLFV